MYEQIEKPKENNSRAVANPVAQKKSNAKQCVGLVDNRFETVKQRKLQTKMDNSDDLSQLKTIQLEKYPNYQTFTDTKGMVWCSNKKVDSHAECATWVGDICSQYKVSVKGKPKVSNIQPPTANWRSGVKYG